MYQSLAYKHFLRISRELAVAKRHLPITRKRGKCLNTAQISEYKIQAYSKGSLPKFTSNIKQI